MILNTPTQADVFDFINSLDDNSIQCVVTSPPYYGLRNYKIPDRIWDGDPDCEHMWEGEFEVNTKAGQAGYEDPKWDNLIEKTEKISYTQFCRKCMAWKGSLGSEPFPELYIKHLVFVFTSMWDKLHNTASIWVNIADSYARSGGSWGITDAKGDKILESRLKDRNPTEKNPFHSFAGILGYKKKDLIGIPWGFAFAMRDAGFYLRQDIIWHKPAPMPEPVNDRCTSSHEYVFLFSKNYKYFYDKYAIMEQLDSPNLDRGPAFGGTTKEGTGNPKYSGNEYDAASLPGRNKRDVWSINSRTNLPRELSGQHFAAFPEKLPETCILAGSPHKVCAKCRAPYVRIVEKIRPLEWKDRGPTSEGEKELREISKEIYGGNQKSRSISDIYGRALESERVQKGFEPWESMEWIKGKNRTKWKQNENWKENLEKKESIVGNHKGVGGDGDIYPQESVYYKPGKSEFTPWDGWKKSCGADSKGKYKGKSRGKPIEAKAQSPSDVKRNVLDGMVPKESKFEPWNTKEVKEQIERLGEEGIDRAHAFMYGSDKRYKESLKIKKETKSFNVTCSCGSSDTTKPIIFDPFMGTFTTAVVAEKLGRDWVGCDISERFVELGKKRLKIQVRKGKKIEQGEWW